MTNAEAKEIVKRIKGYMGDGECWSESEFIAMTNEETNRPYDSAWGMYYDEFDNAKPDEIKTWVDNHTKQDVIGYKLVDDVW